MLGKIDIDINKWIGWIVAVITIVVWLFTSGVELGKITANIENVNSELKKIEAKMTEQETVQQEHFLKQVYINAQVMSFIEEQKKSK